MVIGSKNYNYDEKNDIYIGDISRDCFLVSGVAGRTLCKGGEGI